ncbi:MAG: O-antigen ligase family protein [Patescibacteria group bacterium]|nr:O-antigen ligase family protein [Patescibacteria group bacterium]
MISKVLMILLALGFSFGHLGRISFLDQQINGYLYEIVLLILLLFLFFRFRFKPLIEGYKNYFWFFWLIFYLLVSFLIDLKKYNYQQNLIAFLYQIRLIFYFLGFLYLKKVDLKPFFVVLILVTVPLSLTQFFLYPNLRNLLYLGWDPHIFRLFGLFFDTYVAAAIYGLIFLFLFFKKKFFLRKFLLTIYFLFILLTYSRLGLISFLITLFIYFIINKNYQKILLISGMVFIFIFLVLKFDRGAINLNRMFSIKARVIDYQKGISFFVKKPIFGYGYNRIRFIKNESVSHSGASFSSSFLTVLVGAGLIGFFLFIKSLFQLINKNKFGVYFLIFLGFFSLADNVLLHPFILSLLLMTVILFDKQR